MRQTTEIFIPIPRVRNTHAKVEIDGDDLTGRVIGSVWRYPVTTGIGTFRIELSNANGQLGGEYSSGDVAKFYADNSDGSTLQFFGIIDSVKDSISSKGQILEIEGRHRAYLLTEFLVCYSATNTKTSEIVKDIIGKLPTGYGFTYSNVEEDTTTMDVEWNYKPFWDCIFELCNKGGFDCYVDNDLDFHYFEANSKANDREFVAEGNNFLNSKYIGVDKYPEKTRVIVTGRSPVGLPIIHTAISGTEGGNIKEILVNDESANSMTQVQDIAEAKLAEFSDKQVQAMIESFGLETLTPGENIWLVIPRQQIYGQYKIVQINHKFGAKSGGWRTESIIEEEEKGIASSIQNINQKSDRGRISTVVENVNKFDFSWNLDFNSDSGSHSNTEIVEGILRTDGSATGVWASDILEVPSNVTSPIELNVNGVILEGLKVYLSTNSGVSYTQIYGVGSGLASLKSGKKLKIRVNLASASTQIDGLALLYKRPI